MNDLIEKRYSPRAFSEKPVEEEKIDLLIDAARVAPSSYNSQPWRFLMATKDDPEKYKNVLESLSGFNKSWAEKAPVLMVTMATKNYEHNGKPYTHAHYDLGLAVGNLTIQATELDLYIHQMGGFDANLIRGLFKIPDSLDIVTVLAIGYLGDADELPEDLRKIENQPRQRKSAEDILF